MKSKINIFYVPQKGTPDECGKCRILDLKMDEWVNNDSLAQNDRWPVKIANVYVIDDDTAIRMRIAIVGWISITLLFIYYSFIIMSVHHCIVSTKWTFITSTSNSWYHHHVYTKTIHPQEGRGHLDKEENSMALPEVRNWVILRADYYLLYVKEQGSTVEKHVQ